MGELGPDDVEDRQDGLHQADCVLGGHTVPELQLAQVSRLSDGGQHDQVQVTVIETKHKKNFTGGPTGVNVETLLFS